MAKKAAIPKSKEDESKPIYARLEWVKRCPACGQKSIIQQPNESDKGILECISCEARFRIEIITE